MPSKQLVPVLRRFDGDGMLHAVRISDRRASYSNSYVLTTRLTKERAAGRSLFSKVCDGAQSGECLVAHSVMLCGVARHGAWGRCQGLYCLAHWQSADLAKDTGFWELLAHIPRPRCMRQPCCMLWRRLDQRLLAMQPDRCTCSWGSCAGCQARCASRRSLCSG